MSLDSRRESLYFVFLNFPMVQLFFPVFFGPALVIYQVISSFNTLSKVNQTYNLILKSNSFGLKWIHTDDWDNWFKFMQHFLFHLSSFCLIYEADVCYYEHSMQSMTNRLLFGTWLVNRDTTAVIPETCKIYSSPTFAQLSKPHVTTFIIQIQINQPQHS